MKIIDGHCDLISKMFKDDQVNFLKNQLNVEVNFARLKQANIALQFFAIYMPEDVTRVTFEQILKCIDIFYEKIIKFSQMRFIRYRNDLESIQGGENIGALLTLEGVEGLAGNMGFVRTAFHLGVRCMGITWNHANWAADGISEPRNGGFSILGKQFVRECNKWGIILDVSHLSPTGFWELNDLSSQPFIASHSNAFEICGHARNLSNEQIKAMVQKKGMIGLTFVPWFVTTAHAQITDLLRHLDHIGSLGGEQIIGFGSDFDGVGAWLSGLEHPGHYDVLVNELLKHYRQEQAESFLFQNWYDFLQKNLPLAK